MKDIQRVLKMGPDHTFVYACASEKLPMTFAREALKERADVVLLQLCDFAQCDEFGILKLKPRKSSVVIPHEKIIDMWHEILPTRKKVVNWKTDSRRHTTLVNRYMEILKLDKIKGDEAKALGFFRAFFHYISKCPYLMRDPTEDNNWEVFLEWVVMPKNYEKIINGNYRPKEK